MLSTKPHDTLAYTAGKNKMIWFRPSVGETCRCTSVQQGATETVSNYWNAFVCSAVVGRVRQCKISAKYGCSVTTSLHGAHCRRKSGQDATLSSHLHPVPKLRTRGAIPTTATRLHVEIHNFTLRFINFILRDPLLWRFEVAECSLPASYAAPLSGSRRS